MIQTFITGLLFALTGFNQRVARESDLMNLSFEDPTVCICQSDLIPSYEIQTIPGIEDETGSGFKNYFPSNYYFNKSTFLTPESIYSYTNYAVLIYPGNQIHHFLLDLPPPSSKC